MAMERENRPARGGVRKRKKVCQFCVDKCEHIDYKDAAKLRRFISERSKILPRRTTGTCAMHQRQLTEAIKRARQIALLHFVTEQGTNTHTTKIPTLPVLPQNIRTAQKRTPV